jgi:hypothetical protein
MHIVDLNGKLATLTYETPAGFFKNAPGVMFDSPSPSDASVDPRRAILINAADTRGPSACNHDFHELNAFLVDETLWVLPFLRQANKPNPITHFQLLWIWHRSLAIAQLQSHRP